ncbi:pentatricopeptide repeat domain-containing protein [Cardiosporidium cionae]|uniref:Pentatricopeptide repeat domain-containing protein n=1 Tax=Cardiosporidium cionae TaxID=476202 RepID=A0ABQ7J7Q0_9APIC|nr:pentatricopeptide repeat domain-containing protein [Cardiosporidium cionae]|eukprot:KAF8819978.1 pentatricopeptide repeat domain-containing protein [Cardiosporidium cionae]
MTSIIYFYSFSPASSLGIPPFSPPSLSSSTLSRYLSRLFRFYCLMMAFVGLLSRPSIGLLDFSSSALLRVQRRAAATAGRFSLPFRSGRPRGKRGGNAFVKQSSTIQKSSEFSSEIDTDVAPLSDLQSFDKAADLVSVQQAPHRSFSPSARSRSFSERHGNIIIDQQLQIRRLRARPLATPRKTWRSIKAELISASPTGFKDTSPLSQPLSIFDEPLIERLETLSSNEAAPTALNKTGHNAVRAASNFASKASTSTVGQPYFWDKSKQKPQRSRRSSHWEMPDISPRIGVPSPTSLSSPSETFTVATPSVSPIDPNEHPYFLNATMSSSTSPDLSSSPHPPSSPMTTPSSTAHPEPTSLSSLMNLSSPPSKHSLPGLQPFKLIAQLSQAPSSLVETSLPSSHALLPTPSTPSPPSSGLPEPGSTLISQLKQNALLFKQTGADPSLVESLRSSLSYFPGIERQQRRKEMMAYDETFEFLLTSGKASLENINLLIKAQAIQGRMKEALETYEKMHVFGFDPDVETFTSLLQGCVATQDAALSRWLFLKMRAALITPTERLYATLIKAHVAAGDLKSGFSLLRKMEEEDLKPNGIVYTTLIDGLVKAHRLEKAWKIFWEMRTWKGISPDSVLFTVMIKACAKRKETERALSLFDDMKLSGCTPTDITYTELIHSCCQRKDFTHKAFDFLNQMLAEDMPLTSTVCTFLLEACITSSNVKKAKEIMRLINNHHIVLTPAMYNQLISLFASAMRLPKVSLHERSGYLRYAWHILQVMRQSKITISTSTLNALMKVYIYGGFPLYAIDLLQQYSFFHCKPTATTYFLLLKMFYGEQKDVGRFFTVWKYMRQTIASSPSPAMLHLALEAAMESRSAALTVKIMKEMYEAKVYPTVALTERLVRVGQKITEIHELIGLFVKMEKEQVFEKTSKTQALLQAEMDEHELRLFSEGKTLKTAETAEESVRKAFFGEKKSSAASERGKRRGKFPSWEDYKAAKQKGGEAYAQRHDRPKSSFL